MEQKYASPDQDGPASQRRPFVSYFSGAAALADSRLLSPITPARPASAAAAAGSTCSAPKRSRRALRHRAACAVTMPAGPFRHRARSPRRAARPRAQQRLPLNAAAGAAYGVTDRLTISAELPYIRRDHLREGEHSHSGGVAINEVVAARQRERVRRHQRAGEISRHRRDRRGPRVGRRAQGCRPAAPTSATSWASGSRPSTSPAQAAGTRSSARRSAAIWAGRR